MSTRHALPDVERDRYDPNAGTIPRRRDKVVLAHRPARPDECYQCGGRNIEEDTPELGAHWCRDCKAVMDDDSERMR